MARKNRKEIEYEKLSPRKKRLLEKKKKDTYAKPLREDRNRFGEYMMRQIKKEEE
ncbi:hypothetical protein [Evansella clarkii]|uniref:hypothetical protein n=1 Tax=Evansella clarkii TaxID=79879 RepID=UPI00143011D7|nr:hypothetical protein [Evansella clarkii]